MATIRALLSPDLLQTERLAAYSDLLRQTLSSRDFADYASALRTHSITTNKLRDHRGTREELLLFTPNAFGLG